MKPARMAGVTPKRKEIYKYEAPWTLYSMNWGVRPDKRFRLAVGSFVEEYNNKASGNLIHPFSYKAMLCQCNSMTFFLTDDELAHSSR